MHAQRTEGLALGVRRAKKLNNRMFTEGNILAINSLEENVEN